MKRQTFLAISVLAFASCSINKQQETRQPKTVVEVFTTAQNTDLRLSKTADLKFGPSAQPLETQVFVYVDPKHEFQTFEGVGGALTDAAAETFAKLPAAQQQELLTDYFDPDKGIGYTIGRTNINSCDFSSDSYIYVSNKDKSLSTFNVAHDEKFKIPLIKKAMQTTKNNLKLLVTPWSPPEWMKTNKSMLHGGKLLPEYDQAWADYYVKFIKAYQEKNMPIWALSVQNEPMATQTWESCLYTADEERDFIKNFLGPTLKKNNLGDKKLIAWDHNRDLVYQRASTILNDPEAAQYVWGIGFHWYETWTGSKMQFDNVRKVKEAFPDKHLIFTEGCQEKFNLDSIYNWKLGEKYGHSMVNDFNDGTEAWVDWNILLDQTGGPNHVGNFCFSPIHADTNTGKLMITNAYYYIGQFSKFIKPGAKRINASTNRDKLEVTSFKNPNGDIVVVVLNTSNDELPFKLMLDGKAADAKSLAHSISTFIAKN
ncbi:glucosylceramidase [Pedobacter sp. UYP30]|uniref:glycoside hydrolase family 30 protein n=1 Tax=Pedobacter sp. UYP30 TaxID=1756400 RepID=UPI003398DA7A